MTFVTGKRNLITDVGGLLVGNASNDALKSGVTAIICEEPAVAAVQVLGGSPGSRETDLLEAHNVVETVNAVVLAGGSAFGLDAASGVQAALREQNIGIQVGPHRIPIVPAAILFDLLNGGDKDWGRYPPYRELGFKAVQNAKRDFAIGTHGAGTGALVASLKGGLGSASSELGKGYTVGALAAVNAMGTTTLSGGRHFWAAPFEIGAEFGGLGYPAPFPPEATEVKIKFADLDRGKSNTTIAVIATDACLTKAEAKRLAIAAHDGFAHAIWPTHTPFDGDLVFALATGTSGITPDLSDAVELYAAAGATMARAIARGVYSATPADGDVMPVWASLT